MHSSKNQRFEVFLPNHSFIHLFPFHAQNIRQHAEVLYSVSVLPCLAELLSEVINLNHKPKDSIYSPFGENALNGRQLRG